MYPKSQSESFFVQEIGNEIILFNRVNHSAHCLGPIAARVWHYCDGSHSSADIAKLLEQDIQRSDLRGNDMRALVALTLDELQHAELITFSTSAAVEGSLIIRRELLKKVGYMSLASLASLFPLVRSLTVPTFAQGIDSCRDAPGDPVTACLGGCAGGIKRCGLILDSATNKIKCGCGTSVP